MHASHRRRLAATTAVLGFTGSCLFAVNSAQAYSPNPTVRWAQVDTDNGQRLSGTLTVAAQSDGCRINDSWDGTFFRKDAGGLAIKVELYVGSTLVAKSEFHPYGEVLWAYDTRDDSDTIYTTLTVGEFGDFHGPYRGPVRGRNSYNLTITDGSTVTMSVNDNNEQPGSARVPAGGGVSRELPTSQEVATRVKEGVHARSPSPCSQAALDSRLPKSWRAASG